MKKEFSTTAQVDINEIRSSDIYRTWNSSLNPGFNITEVSVVNVCNRGNVVRSVLLDVGYRNKEGSPEVHHNISLFGQVVAVLPVITCSSDNQQYTLVVQQDRVATGEMYFFELPAGRMETSNIYAEAAREYKEETGHEIDPKIIVELTKLPIFLSPGVSNESVRICFFEIELTYEELLAMQNRIAGLEREYERTTVHVIPLTDLMYFVKQDAKSLVSYALYLEHLKKTRSI